MKKLLSAILIFAMLVSPVLSGFAAVTINPDYTFTDGSTVYVFGTTDGGADEIGITAGGKDYSLSSRKMYQAEKHGIFGIGLKDSKNILGLNFNAAPYEIKGEEKTSGAEVQIEKTDVLSFVTDLTVGGKTVSGFAPGTDETEFYYGLDALPETAEELPAVSVMAGEEALTLSTEAEVGGFVTTASYKNEKVLSVHFREFAEITTTAIPSSYFASRCNWIDMAYTKDLGTSAVPIYVMDGQNLYSDGSNVAFIAYDVPEVNGYAAVGFTLDNVRMYKSSLSMVEIYNSDGTNPHTGTVADFVAEKEANNGNYTNPFPEFKGATFTDAYKLAEITAPEGNTTHSGIVSNTVMEGRYYLIYKGNANEIGKYGRVNFDPANGFNHQMTVKYVEKNPVDVSLSDATAKLVTVDGKVLDGFDADKTEYYVGVENPLELPEIKVVPTQDAASVSEGIHETSDNSVTFTVTAANGVDTKDYKFLVRKIETEVITYTAAASARDGWQSGLDNGYLSIGTDREGYISYETAKSFGEEDMLLSATLSEAKMGYSTTGTFNVYQNIQDVATIYPGPEANTYKPGEYFSLKQALKVDENAYLGSGDGTSGTAGAVALDVSRIEIYNGNTFIFMVKGIEVSANPTWYKVPSLTLSWINKGWVDNTVSNANLKAIKVNGGEVSGFDPEIDEYYVGVYDVSTDPYIEAIPEINGAEAFASRLAGEQTVEINVIAKDGETEKTYYVYYREIQEKTLSPVDFALTRKGYMEESAYKGSGANVIGMARDSYMTYRFPSAEGSLKVVSATLGASRALYTSQAAYQGAFEIYQNHRDISMICDTSVVESEGTVTDNRGNIDSTHLAYKVEDCSPDYLLGSMAGIVSTTQHGDTPPIELDASKIKVEQGNILAFYIRGTSSGINTVYVIPDLTVEYIVID